MYKRIRFLVVELNRVELIPIIGIPEIKKGDDIASIIFDSVKKLNLVIDDNDIFVVKHKIVSKSEGRVISLESVVPSKKAITIANKNKKDPRLVELILRESKRIVRAKMGIIITETRHGFVCANSGVDKSNVPEGYVALLPKDPDRSAREIRRKLERLFSKRLAVVISDTFGRPWRKGQTDVAIGCSGIEPIVSYKGKKDMYGYTLKVTMPAIVDEIASSAELISGKLNFVPVVLVKGLRYKRSDKGVKSLILEKEKDLFR